MDCCCEQCFYAKLMWPEIKRVLHLVPLSCMAVLSLSPSCKVPEGFWLSLQPLNFLQVENQELGSLRHRVIPFVWAEWPVPAASCGSTCVVRVAGCPTKHSMACWSYQLQPAERLWTSSHVRILLELVWPQKRNTENPWDTNDWR